MNEATETHAKGSNPMMTHPRAILPEDSSAFSLDVLRAREAKPQGATETPASESGVIDLNALQTCAPQPDDFVTARLVASPAATATKPTTPRWAVATLGLLGGAVVALATMIAVGSPRGTATRDPAPRPTMAATSLVQPEVPMASALHIDTAVIPDARPPAPAPVPAVVQPEPELKPDVAQSKAKSTRVAKASTAPKAKPVSAPAPAPAVATPKPKAEEDLSVQCILDPASCGKGGTRKPVAAPVAPTSHLPDKLSASQIRDALVGPKSKAKQCAEMHAAPAGTTVKVKLSIAGSGEVRSATPQAPFTPGLGRCVADALATANFEPFGAPQMGVVYSVRL